MKKFILFTLAFCLSFALCGTALAAEPFAIQPVKQGGRGDYALVGDSWVYFDYAKNKLYAIPLNASAKAKPKELKNGSNWILAWGEDVLYFGRFGSTSRGYITNPVTNKYRMIDKMHREFYVPFFTDGDYVYFSSSKEAYLSSDIKRLHKKTWEIETLFSVYGFVEGIWNGRVITFSWGDDVNGICGYDLKTGNRKILYRFPAGASLQEFPFVVNDAIVFYLAYREDPNAPPDTGRNDILMIGPDGSVRKALDEYLWFEYMSPDYALGYAYTHISKKNWRDEPDYLIGAEGIYPVTGLKLTNRPKSYKGGAVVFPGLTADKLIPFDSMPKVQ